MVSFMFLVISSYAMNNVEGNVWSIVFSTLFLFVTYEFERFKMASFLTSKLALEAAILEERTKYEEKAVAVLAIRAKKAKEEEHDLLRSLIGNVAHDMKTPLLSVTMGIEELRAAILAITLSAATANASAATANANCASAESSMTAMMSSTSNNPMHTTSALQGAAVTFKEIFVEGKINRFAAFPGVSMLGTVPRPQSALSIRDADDRKASVSSYASSRGSIGQVPSAGKRPKNKGTYMVAIATDHHPLVIVY
jgi:signal transduction histidine kinase